MKQLEPKAVWIFFVQNLLISIPFIVAVLSIGVGVADVVEAFQFSALGWVVMVFLTLVAIVALDWFIAKLTYRFVWYELKEEGFRKEHGIIWKTYVTIPYTRIQNVDIKRGVIARILGLSDLEIQTAGASATFRRNGAWGLGAEGALPGVSREIAEELRDELIQRARKEARQGL